MAVPTKQADKHWAFCRYCLGLSDSEIKTLSISRFKELKLLWEKDKKEIFDIIQISAARINFMLYSVNSGSKSIVHDYEPFLYYGQPKPKQVDDLKTKDGQKSLSEKLRRMAKIKPKHNGK